MRPVTQAASWDEIASELGVTKTRVCQIYRRAVIKLQRRYPCALQHLQQLASELEKERAARRTFSELPKGGAA